MSLINQMLKDIDRRQGNMGAAVPPSSGIPLVVSRGRAGSSASGWLLGAALLVAVVAGGYWFRQASQAVPAPAVAAPAPAVVTAPVSATPVAAVTAVPAVVPPLPAETPVSPLPPVTKPEKPALPRVPAPESGQTGVAHESVKTSRSTPAAPTADPDKVSKKADGTGNAAPADIAVSTVKRTETPAVGQVMRVLSAEQRADNAYRDAAAHLRQGRALEAQKALQQALADQPMHQDARLLYAQLLQGEGRASEARTLLAEGIALKPQAFALHAALAQMQLLSRDSEQAVATLERGLTAAGDNAAYHALLATALQQQSRHAEAVQHYVVALRQQPDSSNWLVGLGVSLQAQGHTQGAAEAYQRAMDLGLPVSLSQFARDRLQQVSR